MGACRFEPLNRPDHRQLKVLKACVLLVMLCLLWTPLVEAYILPGPYILELMARNLAGAQSLRVQQQVIIDDPEVSDTPVELAEELSYLLPGRFRSEILHNASRRIHVVSYGASLTIVDNRIVSGGDGRFNRYKDLLLYPSRDMLHKVLLSHGVDVGIVSLGRLADRLVFVIGAQYPNENVSQLWIDKLSLLPVRWLNVFSSPGRADEVDQVDFYFKDWQKIDSAWYPMQIESYLNQRHMRSINATQIETNVAISGELMNITHLMSIHTVPEERRQPHDQPPDAVDEVEQAIENFKKKFEP